MTFYVQSPKPFEAEDRESSLESDDLLIAFSDIDSEEDYHVKLVHPTQRWPSLLSSLHPTRLWHPTRRRHARSGRRLLCWRDRRRIWLLIQCLVASFLTLIIFTPIFRPSYTHLPAHYTALETRSLRSTEAGRANPLNEKIFIAVSLYDKDGHLAGGLWGESVLEVIDLLGPDNVFLSIYQSDSGESPALKAFEEKVQCQHEIVNDLNVSRDDFPTVTLPDGSDHIKRILYLSIVRNLSLRPLDRAGAIKYDKILFLNDISFRPVDAAHLLLSTNVGASGRTQYLATCALDYSNPFKFYDLFAIRDAGGYSMGVPFFPIFSNAGEGQSRSDMLNQKDAVRVKSCWSGMVAMDAKFVQSTEVSVPKGFQEIGAHVIDPQSPRSVSAPVRFRAEPEIFFDACECCLFLADLLQVAQGAQEEAGIYVNPYIRVAYSPVVLSWLPITRRFERLYSWPHRMVNAIASMPKFNPLRDVQEGESFKEETWVRDTSLPGNGTWHINERTGRSGLYCGVREMQVIQKSPRTGDTNWHKVDVPLNQKIYFPT